MSQYARDGGATSIAATAIVIAALSNTVVKGGMAVATGSAEYRRKLLMAMAIICVVGGIAAVAEAMLPTPMPVPGP